MFVYRCEDTLDNIFTAIYRVYEDRNTREEVLLVLDDDPRLFATDLHVKTDAERCKKVIRTLLGRFGADDYEALCLALAAPDGDKAQAVYRTVAQGLQRKCAAGHLFDNLADDDVCRAFKLARGAGRENCHLRGFLRFEELQGGILYARIKPMNHLLPFLMPHFADRFPEEDFLIHDMGRGLVGVHPKHSTYHRMLGEQAADADAGKTQEWLLVDGEEISSAESQGRLLHSAMERQYQMLFKCFCSSIAIRERTNTGLQQGMLPLHFREYMPEFH